jgi:hypothetical protein
MHHISGRSDAAHCNSASEQYVGYASDGDALTGPLADLNNCDVSGGYLSEQGGISRYARQMQVLSVRVFQRHHAGSLQPRRATGERSADGAATTATQSARSTAIT